jgi:hypothetical protein
MGKLMSSGMIYWEGVTQHEGPKKKRNGQQRKTDLSNDDGRVSKKEELVDSWDYDGPSEAKYPSTECRRGHGWVIGIGNRGADFGIWRLILEFRGHRVEIWVVIVVEVNFLRVSNVGRIGSIDERKWRGKRADVRAQVVPPVVTLKVGNLFFIFDTRHCWTSWGGYKEQAQLAPYSKIGQGKGARRGREWKNKGDIAGFIEKGEWRRC